jgi:hypothetical protein
MENKAENLFVFATKNNELAKEIEEIVKKHEGIEIIRLEDRLLDDLVSKQSKEENKPQTVEEFVNNEENRNSAETKALSLWNMLTNNQDLFECNNRIFTSAEVTTRTNLSHRKLKNLLELFDLFGLVEFVNGKRHEFKLIFGEKTKQANVYVDIIQDVTNLNDDIARYKAIFKDEEKEKAVEELKTNIPQLIKY